MAVVAVDALEHGAKIVDFIQKRRSARLVGQDRLRLDAKMPEWPQRVHAAKDVLKALAA